MFLRLECLNTSECRKQMRADESASLVIALCRGCGAREGQTRMFDWQTHKSVTLVGLTDLVIK
jgi:hypothetical protein